VSTTVELSSADLAELMASFNQATSRLQATHERLEREVVRLRGELSSANAQLERARRLAALGEMAAGIAHEVRNPLGSIGLYARMLEQDLQDRPTQCDTAKKIARAVRGLNAIVGDVLDFAKPLAVHASWVDVRDLFERAVALAGPEAIMPGVRIEPMELASPGEGKAGVWADASLLEQALVNLIRNAAEAMRDHAVDARDRDRVSVEPRLVLAWSAGIDGSSTLLIGDNGPGVPKDVLDRMFNPFFTTRASGTGLGLAIVHRLIDAHGGRIRLLEPGSGMHGRLGVGGAIFEISLPGAGVGADMKIRHWGGDKASHDEIESSASSFTTIASERCA
jgi:signal transduction histidine kinase